jgi:uncharacterized protein (DUF1501 family)
MKRRDFVKNIPILAAPFLLNGIPINMLAGGLNNLAAQAVGDRVLILIQMHGGNDGLNTVIPVDQYGNYFNLRPNIAIPSTGLRKFINLDSTLPIADQVGLHPDMTAVKSLYDDGKAAIVQGVAYENLNQSHFRSRDIWLMGGDYDDYLGSGWMGRYLDHVFPNYPTNYPNAQMPDPPAIEIGTSVSLAFHKATGIPISLSINDPDQFYNLIKGVGGDPPSSISNTHYGDELRYIIGMEQQSNVYSDRLKAVYDAGSNSANVTYPSQYPGNAPSGYFKNELAPQLKLIARLLAGGSKTKIFLTRIGRFDTHANQVEATDTSVGGHAALLYHISSAMKAFQDDLKGLGLEDRVMSVTFSEFGRRAASNGSYGTDHGTSAPMFVFGKCVKPGVIGTNPDLNNLDNGNLRQQFDYRQVFTTMLQDWLGADSAALSDTLFQDFENQKLDLVECSAVSGVSSYSSNLFKLNSCYPNPANSNTTISFFINDAALVKLGIFDNSGKLLIEVLNENRSAGNHEVNVDVSHLPPGGYLYKVEAGRLKGAKRMIVVR